MDSKNTDAELARLSWADLAASVLELRDQLTSLQTAVCRLEERVAQGSDSRDALDQFQTGYDSKDDEEDLDVAIRKALEHLDDVSFLQRSALAKRLTKLSGTPPGGKVIQQTLYQAIDEVGLHAGAGGKIRLHQQLLRLTYLEKWKSSEVATHLSISERQYYRHLKNAIASLTNFILDRGRFMAETRQKKD